MTGQVRTTELDPKSLNSAGSELLFFILESGGRAVQTLPRVLLVFLLDLRFTRFPLLPDPSVSV